MRLELRQVGSSPARGKAPAWVFEHGRRSLGRAADCDWQMQDPDCRVSKHHCTIERDRDGFLLRDQSANGTRVDERLVLEGQTARLENGSQLEMAGMRFSIRISGENTSDIEDPAADLRLSDETLTISAILADIAPGGRTASGILGERANDDWLPPDGKTRNASSSRNVEIGWSGPPQVEGLSPILPTDWNSELETGSALEHGAATRAVAPIRRKREAIAEEPPAVAVEMPIEDSAAPESTLEDIEKVFADLGEAPAMKPPQQLDVLIRQLEEAHANTLSIFDIEAADLGGAGSVPLDRDAALSARLEGLLHRHVALNAAFERLLNEASHRLEPRIIEAGVDGEPGRLPWPRKKTYWQAYRSNFERSGKSLSVRDLFREAMTGSAGEQDEVGLTTKGRIDRAS